MKAIFEIKFKLSDIIDRKTINDEFNGDVLKAIKWVWEEDKDMGMFDDEIKLINVIK